MPNEMALPIYTRMQKIKEEVDAVNHRHVDRLINEALVPVYQSIIDNKTHETMGYELLSRFLIEGKLREPFPVIQMLENTRQIVSLDLKSIENAGKTFKKLVNKDKRNQHMKISINLSSITLKNESSDRLLKLIEEQGTSPEYIVIEITERQLIKDEQSLDKLHRLKEKGFQIALDDFSMGHASLSLINRFPFDEVKLDQSVLPKEKEDIRSMNVYRYLVELLKEQGVKKIVAEGIETAFQAEFLSKLDVDYLQGFYFSKPERL